jgi:hypothetical protein
MNIEKLLLEGCRITMPYKDNKEDWVGDMTIFIFAGGCGIKPRITVFGCDIHVDFELEEMDTAIEYFKKTVFNPKNLMYKMNEVMRELTILNPDIDLDEENDYNMVRKTIDARL